MDTPITPAAVRSRALAAHVSLSAVLRRASVFRSSFSRWENGKGDLSALSARKIADALTAIEAERAA